MRTWKPWSRRYNYSSQCSIQQNQENEHKNNSMIRPITIILLSILSTCPVPCHSQQPDRVLFERLVTSTKYFEGWHTQSKTPGHVGYGHKIQQGEHFRNSLTRRQADSLLRSDLIQHYRLYSRYGKDAYLLAALSYQIGPARQYEISKVNLAHPFGERWKANSASLFEVLQVERESHTFYPKKTIGRV